MITLDEAKQLKYREVLVDNYGKRWYVNGKVQLWKTQPNRIRIPLKHGLYNYDEIRDTDFFPNGECHLLTKEQ
jgi:hypothetical protein